MIGRPDCSKGTWRLGFVKGVDLKYHYYERGLIGLIIKNQALRTIKIVQVMCCMSGMEQDLPVSTLMS
jgi:hypothetical protein